MRHPSAQSWPIVADAAATVPIAPPGGHIRKRDHAARSPKEQPLMPTTVASDQVPRVDKPKHPLHALATFELKEYRRQLEQAIGYYGKHHPTAPVLAILRKA